MWAEAILAKTDLERVIAQMGDVSFSVGNDGRVSISEPRDVELVPDVGLRMTVTAEIHWPVLGVELPLSLRAVTLEVQPLIVSKQGADVLAFKLRLDQVDASLLPAFVDREIVNVVNKELEAKHIELAWDFAATLGHVFPMPAQLVSVGSLELQATSGRVRITSEALALAVLFEARVAPRGIRDGVRPATAAEPVAPAAPAPRPPLRESRATTAAMCGIALVAGMGLWAILPWSRRRRSVSLRELLA